MNEGKYFGVEGSGWEFRAWGVEFHCNSDWLHRGYIGIMETKMEAIIWGVGFRGIVQLRKILHRSCACET